MNNDFFKSISIYHKCSLCRKTKGQHQATSFHCPVGMRGCANTYSFSLTQVFTPRLPKLPVAVKRALGEFENAAVDEGHTLSSEWGPEQVALVNRRYSEARFNLHTLLNQLLTK